MSYHHINTLECKLQLTNKELHEPLQRKIMQFYDVELFRVIDRVLQKFEKFNVELEEVKLQLPPIPEHRFSNVYVLHVEKAFTDYLEAYGKELEKQQKKTKILQAKNSLSILINYLNKGYYVNTATTNFSILWEDEMKNDSEKLLLRLSENTSQAVLQRLVHQLTEIKLWELVARFHPSVKFLKEYSKLLQHAAIFNLQSNTAKPIKKYAVLAPITKTTF